MTNFKCGGCGQDFVRYQYYNQHIKATGNTCSNAIRADGTRHPKFASPRKGNVELLDDISKALKEEEDLKKEEELNCIFEFVDDLGPPAKRIRVGSLPTGAITTANPDEDFEDDDDDDKSDSVDLKDSTLDPEKRTLDLDQRTLDLEKRILQLEERNLEVNESNVDLDKPNLDLDKHTTDSDGGSNADTDMLSANATSRKKKEQQEEVRERATTDQFRQCVNNGGQHFADFSKDDMAAIELMRLMDCHKGSLQLYSDIVEWHSKHLGATRVVGHGSLHKRLMKRYNMGPIMPYEISVELPSSKEKVHLPCHDIKSMTIDLLTDTRLTDDDYLFFENDPLAPLPEDWDAVGDVNTGRAYRETYRELIEPNPLTDCGRKKVLIPFMFYLDACVTGQHGNLSIEILKFTVGILNGECRKKSWAWKHAGYVKKLLKKSSQAQRMFSESDHVGAQEHVTDPSDRKCVARQEEGPAVNADWQRYGECQEKDAPEVKAQDLHAMLQAMLDSYHLIEEEGGIEWDLRYRGKTHRLLLVPFIAFAKVDGAEADKLCGHYVPKLGTIQNICRYCVVRTEDTDKPYLEPQPQVKTQQMIESLVRNVNREAGITKAAHDDSVSRLKEISQHEIWNAWYRHRFGSHNQMGIHGATPWETLHHIQLGLYKYNRQSLFLQTGESSKLSSKFDALCEASGQLLGRQSDRDLPRTTFTDGTREGKMQAHEMTGVMILMLVTLRSRAGRNLLLDSKNRKSQKDFVGDEESIREWIRMLERHLMFEQWCKQKELKVFHLERAKIKIRELMAETKHTCQRAKGMGHNTANFHGFTHLPQIYLDLAAPVHLNTQENEGHHIGNKGTAKRTNQQADTFDISHSNKSMHKDSVEQAWLEMCGARKRWHYLRRMETAPEPDIEPFEPRKRGPWLIYNFSAEENSWSTKVHSKMRGLDKYHFDDNTAAFIVETATDLLTDHGMQRLVTFGHITLFSKEAEKNKQHYYAMPHSRGRPKQNWAVFNLSDPDSDHPNARRYVPAQIKCFLDLTSLPENNAVQRDPGLYAIIEPTIRNDDVEELGWSALISAWVKLPCPIPGFQDSNKQELVSLERLMQPCIMVPDIAHPNKRSFLKLGARKHWGHQFEDWLELEHTRVYE